MKNFSSVHMYNYERLTIWDYALDNSTVVCTGSS